MIISISVFFYVIPIYSNDDWTDPADFFSFILDFFYQDDSVYSLHCSSSIFLLLLFSYFLSPVNISIYLIDRLCCIIIHPLLGGFYPVSFFGRVSDYYPENQSIRDKTGSPFWCSFCDFFLIRLIIQAY